jgi:hypothetical protein
VRASGSYVSLMLIFTRAKERDAIKGDACLGSAFAFSYEISCFTKELYLV